MIRRELQLQLELSEVDWRDDPAHPVNRLAKPPGGPPGHDR
jgi:hypothetical protein